MLDAGHQAAPSPNIVSADHEDEGIATDNATVSISAYGLYWERDQVEWDVSYLSEGGVHGATNLDFFRLPAGL